MFFHYHVGRGKADPACPPSAIRPYRGPAVALCPLRLVLPWTYRGFPTAVGDCGRTAWEAPDCQASKAAGRSIRWIRWIRPVLRRTDTSLRVRAPQIHQIPGFPGQTQFPAVSECFRCLNQYIIDQSVIPFWSILPIFCLCFFHSRWGLHPHIDGETRPEITDNDGKPYLCTDEAWT